MDVIKTNSKDEVNSNKCGHFDKIILVALRKQPKKRYFRYSR